VAPRNGTDEVRPAPDPLDDYPVDPAEAQHDRRHAQMAVVIHAPEDWPTGKFCRNCHARWPCRLCRWGVQVLQAAGWADADIVALVRRAEAGELPWS
jgi:hypothetical protein